MRRLFRTYSLVLLCGSAVSAAAMARATEAVPPPGSTNTAPGTWAVSVGGVTVELTPLLPDQLRAFYVNRGVPIEAIEPYANSCVFMAVMRNETAAGPARFRLSNWRVVADGVTRPPPSADEWLQRLGLDRAARALQIAFRWAQFPAEQEYQPGGDWNQGMLAMDLPAKSRFDLIARWTVSGQGFEGVLREVSCAN